MGNDRRNQMSADTKKHITDAFKMKKRLSSCLSLKQTEQTGVLASTPRRPPSPVAESNHDQLEATASLKRGSKSSPAYLRGKKKTRLSQKKNARGVTPVRSSRPVQLTGELRRSPRGILQRTPNGPKRSLAPQESPQEISWDGQSPKYRQQLKSGFDKGNMGHKKNVTEIINVLKTDKLPLEETKANPLLDLWLLSKPSNQQHSTAAEASRRVPAKKSLKNPRRICDELAQLMKTAQDTNSTTVSSAKISELPGDEDNFWDDDTVFNDDSFIRQTQITETEYFSQQTSAFKSSKKKQMPENSNLAAEPVKSSPSVGVPSSTSSVKSRYTFRSNIPKTKRNDLVLTSNQTTVNNDSQTKLKTTSTPQTTERAKMVGEVLDFNLATQNTQQYYLTPDNILCTETQATNSTCEDLVGSNSSSLKLPVVGETQATSYKNSYNFSPKLAQETSEKYVHSSCSQKEARVQTPLGMCTQSSANVSLRGMCTVNDIERSGSVGHCSTENNGSEYAATQTTHPTTVLEDLSGMFDDDFILEPDLLEVVEAAESTYLAACQPSSPPSSQIQCTQEEISKKREAALQRRREKLRVL